MKYAFNDFAIDVIGIVLIIIGCVLMPIRLANLCIAYLYKTTIA